MVTGNWKLQGLIGLNVDITHLNDAGLPQCKPTQVSFPSQRKEREEERQRERERNLYASSIKSTILKVPSNMSLALFFPLGLHQYCTASARP